jgi:hypothetical protein
MSDVPLKIVKLSGVAGAEQRALMIIRLTWPETVGRRWLSCVSFLVLTEQRRSRLYGPSNSLTFSSQYFGTGDQVVFGKCLDTHWRVLYCTEYCCLLGASEQGKWAEDPASGIYAIER